MKSHSLINNEETKTKYIRFLHEIKKEYEDLVKHEVQQALSSNKDAIEKLKSGASLIQLYTGFIYEGPSVIKKINKRIIEEKLFKIT